jgi:hypothetical protein
MIYNNDEITEQPQVFAFRGIEVEYTRGGTRYWSIRADFIADSGQKFGFASRRERFEIHEYEGARKIRDLVTYPLQFYENEAALRKELVERGKKYSRLSTPTIWKTSGPAMTEERNSNNWETRLFKFTVCSKLLSALARD